MKNWEEMTPEEQDKNSQVQIRDERTGLPIQLHKETLLLLTDKGGAWSLYGWLLFLDSVGWLTDWTQEQIAENLGITYQTYLIYRNKLVELGAVRIEKKWRRTIFVFQAIELKIKIRNVFGYEHQVKHLQELRSGISVVTKEVEKEKKEQEEKMQQGLLIDGLVAQKVQEEKKKEQAKKKAEEEKFPSADYASVIQGYRKSKGVGVMPHSPEEMRLKRSIKLMFRSGYTVYDILKCMEFFKLYSNKDGYSWMTHWTMETIYKKIGEFKAGKLKRPEIGDDIPEA